MKIIAALLVSLATLAASAADRTWIGNVMLVSPEKMDHVERGGVLIEDGRIVDVRRGEAQAPKDAKVVDGRGRFLVPGLIDSHVHLAIFPGTWDRASVDPALVRAYFDQLPRSFLYYGYTTLVDLVVFDQATLDDFRRAPLHPDLYDCGPALSMANGYPMALFPPELGFKLMPNWLFDPAHPTPIPADAKPEDHTPEAAVARVKASGAICMKTFIERGFRAGRALPSPDAAMLARIRKAATDAGLLMFVHASSIESQFMAMEAHADVIAHGMWHWGQFDQERQIPPQVAAVLDRIAASHIGYQPTMRVLYGESAYFDKAYLDLPELHKVVPDKLIEWFRTPEGQAFKKQVSDGSVPDEDMAGIYALGPLRRVKLATAYLDRKGANLIFGTDTPSTATYGNLPGVNGYLEMREWQASGISLERIFRAATIDNARQLRLDKDIGSIEKGKAANLLLMEKNPLATLDAYDSIVTVWIHGKQVARRELAANPGPPSRSGER